MYSIIIAWDQKCWKYRSQVHEWFCNSHLFSIHLESVVFFSHGFPAGAPPGFHFTFLCHNSGPRGKDTRREKHYSPAEKQLKISLILLGSVNLFPDSDTHMLSCNTPHTFHMPFRFYRGNLKRVVCNPQSTFQSSALCKQSVIAFLILSLHFGWATFS